MLAATALAAVLPSIARAADLPSQKAAPLPPLARRPAVDGVNGKVEAFGGWADYRGLGRTNATAGGLGSLSFPLGESFGAQIDAIAASHRGSFIGGGGGHLFWRDPSIGLLGAYGTIVHNERLHDTRFRIGGEASAYLGPFTLSGVAGYEEGSATAFSPVAFAPGAVAFDYLPRRGRFFDMFDASYYLTDDLRLSVGHRYIGGRHAAAVGGEMQIWSFGAAAVSAFVEGRIGESDYKAGWGGVRVYFGQSGKSLIRRHREDDPPNWLKDDMFSAQNGRRRGVFVAPPPAPPPPAPEPRPNPCGPTYPIGR